MSDQDDEPFLLGVIAGLTAFAYWKDGVEYVGTTGMTLKHAIELARQGKLYIGTKRP